VQISNRIHALKIPFSIPLTPDTLLARFVYVYLIYGNEDIILIDTGVAGSEKIIFAYLEKTGRSRDDIATVLLTHAHPDHIGAAAAIQAETGACFAAHAAARAWVEDVAKQAAERPVPGFSSLVGGPVRIDLALGDGDVLRLDEHSDLQVLHTPGHSAGSVCFRFPPEAALFCGDAMLRDGDMPVYDDALACARSLRKLAHSEPVDLLLSSWSDPLIHPHLHHEITGALDYLQRIHAAVRSAGDYGEPMALCAHVIQALGLPKHMANPLVARALLSHQALSAYADIRDIGEK